MSVMEAQKSTPFISAKRAQGLSSLALIDGNRKSFVEDFQRKFERQIHICKKTVLS